MPKTIKLSKPIHLGDGPAVDSITFRDEIVAGDMRGIALRDPLLWDDILKLAGRLCGQPDAVINRLSFADLQEVAALVGGFFGAGQATGPGVSQS